MDAAKATISKRGSLGVEKIQLAFGYGYGRRLAAETQPEVSEIRQRIRNQQLKRKAKSLPETRMSTARYLIRTRHHSCRAAERHQGSSEHLDQRGYAEQ